MNDDSAARGEALDNGARHGRPLVWDAPVRVFHWLMVASFAGAYLTAESEPWRPLHLALGYAMAGLVVFRIIWGLVGTRHARFASFVRGPAAVKRYLGTLLRGDPEHHVGHNPAGGWAIVALLAFTLAVAGSGWSAYNEFGGDVVEHLHGAIANLMLALIGLHVAGVLIGSWLHRENLVAAMINGRKQARPDDGVPNTRASVAVLLFAAVLGFAWLQWQFVPPSRATDGRAATIEKSVDHDGDHD